MFAADTFAANADVQIWLRLKQRFCKKSGERFCSNTQHLQRRILIFQMNKEILNE